MERYALLVVLLCDKSRVVMHFVLGLSSLFSVAASQALGSASPVFPFPHPLTIFETSHGSAIAFRHGNHVILH